MKEIIVAENSAKPKGGSDITVDYCILSEQLFSEDGEPVCECYGVKLKSSRGECAIARAMTLSLRSIQALIAKLCQNMVMPFELEAVLEDMAAE